MKPRLNGKVTAFFILFSLQSLPADWRWDNDLAVTKSTPNGYEAKLTFHNTGKSTITVTDVAFACPCTISHFTATRAKPGETGTLTVVIEREKEGLGDDLEAIVSGSPSTKPRELTIRLEKSEPGK